MKGKLVSEAVRLVNVDGQWGAFLSSSSDLGVETYTAYGQTPSVALRGLADLMEGEQR